MQNETVEILRITRDDQGLNVTMSISPESAPQAMKVLAASAELFGGATSIAATASNEVKEAAECSCACGKPDCKGLLFLPDHFHLYSNLLKLLEVEGWEIYLIEGKEHVAIQPWDRS